MRVACQGVIADLEVAGTKVPEGAEVSVEAQLEMVQGGVLVTGTVRAPWEGQCRRCLEAARGEVSVRVREFYGSQASSDDEDVYPLGGDQLDLEPLARDAVLLELPLAPLCREGCQGLCPVCGADRNRLTCGCDDQLDPRWAGLNVLRGGESA